ncbi:MAG: hypothetical protein E7419_05600 [Ruminococcaceae bacterium]|nr:hypothetical protein [Oscillospiraceae bacterium]
MHSECNTLTMALFENDAVNYTFISENVLKISPELFLIIKKKGNKTVASPLYIHSFRFITPKKVVEAQLFMLKFPDPNMITEVSDKLRYYRHKKGLYQIDIADRLGIQRSSYSAYEEHQKDYYAPALMDKIAEILEVDVYALLDDYNRFMYDGQGTYIKNLRKKLGVTQKELAKLMNVDLFKVKRWEQNKVRMFKFTWEKLISLN